MTVFVGRRELLDAFRAGEPTALEEVYWAYVDLVAHVVLNGCIAAGFARSHDHEADLVQETFVRAFEQRARHAYDGVRPYRPYLLTICRNLLVDRARARGRELRLQALAHLESVAESSEAHEAPHDWADPQTMTIVKDYVAGLEPALAAVYEQRYVKGVSQIRAAEALNLSRQQVRTIENKLRKGLRRALTRQR